MGTASFEGQVPELVDHQQFRLRVEEQAIGELTLALGYGEGREQRGGTGEEHRVASLDGGAAQRDGQMRFADAWRAEDQHIFGGADETARGELADQALIDRRLEL